MPLSRPGATLQDYCDHLRILARWVNDLTRLGVEGSRLDAEARAIDADLRECARLASLEVDKAPSRLETASLVLPAPSRAVGLGARYVLEGSRLGAKVLYRELAAPLSPHPLAYLSGLGWARSGAWHDFLIELRQQLVTEGEIEAACEGAKAAFGLLLLRCEPQLTAP